MRPVLILALGLAWTLTSAAAPVAAPPTRIIIQTRPDQVGDRYSYTEHRSGDASEAGTDESEGYTVEILEVNADGLRFVRTLRNGPMTPDVAKGEPPYGLGVGERPARLEDESSAITAANWTDWDLTRVGVLQYRGPFELATRIDGPDDMGGGMTLKRTTEIRDYDAATCQVRVIHLVDFFDQEAGRHHTLRSDEIISTRDGWTIRYELLDTELDGSTGTLTIVRDGPAPGC